jgi:hypothetical protein
MTLSSLDWAKVDKIREVIKSGEETRSGTVRDVIEHLLHVIDELMEQIRKTASV